METIKKYSFALLGIVLVMTMLGCSLGSLVQGEKPTPTNTVMPTPVRPSATQTPTPPSNPLPDLEGFWQDGSRVFTIEWQTDQYVVTAINSAGTENRILTGQSWDGSSLTWTYEYSDEFDTLTVTYTTTSVSGDDLYANYSSSSGTSNVHYLKRNPSQVPSYDDLPYFEDFSNPDSGWDEYDTDADSVGYGDGFYFVISKTNEYSSFGAVGNFYGDVVIDVDARPFSGPNDGNYSYEVGCRLQSNADGYVFKISGDGYYAVGVYSGGGEYTSLSGGEWLYSAAILQGLQTNHMTATCNGNQLILEVNGQVLYEVQDDTFTSGEVSLGAATYDANNLPVEVRFDDLVVTAP